MAQQPCPDCRWSGRCPRCGGTGYLEDLWSGRRERCPECNGTGVCRRCLGSGQVPRPS